MSVNVSTVALRLLHLLLRKMSNDAYTDVVELCALLQCLGFSVKSLDTSDANMSQDGGTRTVVINCQSSGLNVVLESPSVSCSCPATSQNSGIWQVSGMAGGKQLDKEFGCTLLGSLPKTHRERLTKELREMIRCIRQHNESDVSCEKPAVKEASNKSASMVEISTPEKRLQIKVDTPTRYRSLDTLTDSKAENDQQLPPPGPLTKPTVNEHVEGDEQEKRATMCRRQSTYTLSSTPGSMIRRNKTSSPIHTQNSLLDKLIEAEIFAENLRNKLALLIREFIEEGKNDSSLSSLVLDVSKISVLKTDTNKAQFASSPNLSGMGLREEFTKSRLKRFDSASTSNLAPKKQTPNEKPSRLRRISPNIFKLKKDELKTDKSKPSESKGSKLNNLFKSKIATPVSRPTEYSPSLSATKKRFSHIKSTIPKPSPLKKE